MSKVGELWRRVRILIRRDRFARELDEEMRLHRESKERELAADGLSEEEARFAANRTFGNSMRLQERGRETWGWERLESFGRDVRIALRTLRKSVGFSVVAVVTLALGIGANTAIFGLVNATLLQPLPFPEPEQLVRVYSTRGGTTVNPSPLDARDLAAENRTFEGMALNDAWRKSVSGLPDSDVGEQQHVGIVQAEWFSMLRMKPILGELWTASADEPGRNYVTVLGERFWRDRYHGDPNVIGKILKINEEGYTIIGVVPDAIPQWFYDDVPLWTPFVANPQQWQEFNRANRGYWVVGRLKAGVSLAQARADLETVAADLAKRYPIADREISATVRPLAEMRAGDQKPVLLMLVGAVALVLLITCANLANLLLARNTTRYREFAVRTAVGAGRRALVRLMLVESMLLALGGGGLGLLLAYGASAALVRYHPAEVPQLAAGSLDWRVLGFTFVVCLLTASLFGVLPAITGSRVNLVDGLREGGRSGMGGMRGQRLRRALVVSEMALALMLLATTGLLVRSVLHMETQNLGLPTDHILTARFFLPGAFRVMGPAGSNAITRASEEISRRVAALPGVKQVAISAAVPPEDIWNELFTVAKHPAATIGTVPVTKFNSVDWRFRATLGIPLVRGRDFAESDDEQAVPVALINQAMVRRHFGSENPLGEQIYLGPPETLRPLRVGQDGSADQRFTIVGVLADTKNNGLAPGVEPELVTLFRQTPGWNFGFKRITVKTSIDPHQLEQAVRREIQSVDRDAPVTDMLTMQERVLDLDASNRFTTTVLGLMAGLGVALSVVGIYGVISYLVALRRQEFGVRLALGASPGEILRMTLRQGLRMTAIGAAAGLLGTAALGGVVARMLYEVSPLDPAAICGAAGFLFTVALVACAVPARRAAKISPMVALRYE
jgi:predicted permease